MSLRTWARRIGLGLVAGGSVAALLALTGAPQAAPQLEWTHSGTSVTHFECFVDGAYAGNLGLPTPSGNAYSANLSLCGQITGGQHTLTVKACNYTNCTDTTTSLALVALGTIGTGTEACVGPAQDDVQAAVAAADYGDKVQVCAGSATWTIKSQGCTANTALCMKKGISLVGGIGGATVITLAGTPQNIGAIAYEADATSVTNDTPFSFTGFIVDAGGLYTLHGMVDIRNYTGATALTKITIHDNTLRNGAVGAKGFYVHGPVYGVAYDNTVIDITGFFRAMGDNDTSWALGHREYGTVNSFFVEDNIVSLSVGSALVETGDSNGQGASMVSRYNTIDLANMKTPTGGGLNLIDLHGLQSMSSSASACNGGCLWPSTPCYTEAPTGTRCCQEWSQVKSEVYGNSWPHIPYGGWNGGWVIHRGSWMLMFANDAVGTAVGSFPPQPMYRQYSCDECQSPASPAYSQHIQNTYVWGNFYNGAVKPLIPIYPRTNHNPYETADLCADGISGGYEITENRDYFNYTASFDGTVGIGCGVLASRPETCTTGVAYWATTQSCSDMTGMVGAHPATPISGTLYKCKATNTWQTAEEAYTPYTYPHPKAATPAAASSLRVK